MKAMTKRPVMILRTLVLALALMLPQMALATCNGTDLRTRLTTDQTDALATLMRDMPYPDGNHWVAHKGALTIHLIGTLHLADPRLPAIAAGLAPVVASADMMLVEATEVEESQLLQALATRPELISLTSGPTLIDLMPPETWAKLAQAASEREIPSFMAAKFQPWYLSLVLGMPPCVFSSVKNDAHGLDKTLLQIAEDNGVPATALEPFDTLFTLMAEAPLDEQIKMLGLGLMSVQQSEDMTATLVEQYFEEDHGAIMPLNRVMASSWIDLPKAEFDVLFDETLDTLLIRRNAMWLPKITSAQGVVVVAVGAGHLGGEGGLLQLLDAAGFALRRQPF